MNEEIRLEGQKAAAISPLVSEFVIAQTAAIVSRLTVQYNSGRLTPEAALAGIGELAAVDRLIDAVESRIGWLRGGTSLYFRDPDGHSLEVATPGLWPNR